MGTLSSLLTTNKMMKIAVVVCCAALAAAEAEADPAFPFSTSGYSVPRASAYNYRGLVQPQAWTAYTAPVSSYTLRAPSVRGYTTLHPAQPLGLGYGYATVGAQQSQGQVTVGVHQPYGYAASGRYVANSVGAVHFAKRSAEAEPEAEADPQFLNFQAERLGYSHYGYGLPSAYSVAQPYSQIYTGYSNPAISYSLAPSVYRGLGYQTRYHF